MDFVDNKDKTLEQNEEPIIDIKSINDDKEDTVKIEENEDKEINEDKDDKESDFEVKAMKDTLLKNRIAEFDDSEPIPSQERTLNMVKAFHNFMKNDEVFSKQAEEVFSGNKDVSEIIMEQAEINPDLEKIASELVSKLRVEEELLKAKHQASLEKIIDNHDK